MKFAFLPSPTIACWLAAWVAQLAAPSALAQVPPPPLPPAPEEGEWQDTSGAIDGRSAPVSLGAESGASGATADDALASETTRSVAGSEASSGSLDRASSAESEADPSAVDGASLPLAVSASTRGSGAEAELRERSSRRQTTIFGSTGVFRVREAGSGSTGSFRINVLGSYFASPAFLCAPNTPCTDPVTGELATRDLAVRTQAIANLSVTPLPFLEAFLGVHNSATSNSEGTPELLQVVGDVHVGLKGFVPAKPDRILSVGAQADLYLLTGTGGIGLSGAATSAALRGLGTLDLNNRTDPNKRIPLRAHVNLGYFLDNSSKIVEELEQTPPSAGRGEPVARTERFGLGISRVDALEVGLAAEYIHPFVRPFVEWTVDIAVNRQSYECSVPGALSRGDRCLGARTSNVGEQRDVSEARLGTMPSRLSFGARVFPWQKTGLAITAAADIGTGATNSFLEEVTPEAPYALWLGLGYTVDVLGAAPREVPAPAPTNTYIETRRYIIGRVLHETTGTPIPDALIRYRDVPMTGLLANEFGEFITQDLPPGSYTFSVFAEEFKTGSCTMEIPETAPEMPVGDKNAEASSHADDLVVAAEANRGPGTTGSAAHGADGADEAAYQDADGNILVPATCRLKELPQIANVTGLLVDAKTGGAVSDATVTITDKLNRSLELKADEAGAFQFRNVPFGTAQLRAEAPGYLPTVSPLLIESRQDLEPHVPMNPRPERLGVKLTRSEIQLDRPIRFVGDTSEIAVDSLTIVEELAVALMEGPELGNVQIEVHTDDSGAASYARRLSQERADVVRTLLLDLGVKRRRITAKGFGPDHPLVPNISDANRRYNNRVQVMIRGEDDTSD